MSEVFDAKSVVIHNDNVTVVKLKSNRDTDIHTSIMMPEIADGGKCPLVLILHGFLGDRNEYGMFHGGAYTSPGLADELQTKGIASVRVDFAGSGDSTESFEGFTLNNMVSDIEAAYNYVMENYPAVDAERLAILGWSMGAKVASKFAAAHPEMKVLVLWSPAVQDGLGDLYFMKQLSTFAEDENLDNMEYARKLQSEAMENGRAFFSQEYNAHDVYLSKEFFSEIEEATPIQWINDYSGSKLAVIPSGDTVIPKKTYEDLCSKTDVRRIFIDSDHDLGFEGSSKDATLSAIEVTVGYLYKELM